MRRIHIAVGTKYDFDDFLHDAIKNRITTTWPVPKTATPGDDIYFLIPSRYGKICARGTVKNQPVPSPNWKSKYEAEIEYIVRLPKSVSIRTIAEMIPKWLYPTNAKNYTTVPSDFVEAFLNSLGKPDQAEPVKKKRDSIAPIACDITEPPGRAKTTINRIIRDTMQAKNMKQLYRYRCQVCNLAIRVGEDQLYAEVHHIRPLGRSHKGLDEPGNLIVLCPSHHAMFDFGVPRFSSPKTVEIERETIRLKSKHKIREENIDYYMKNIWKRVAGGAV